MNVMSIRIVLAIALALAASNAAAQKMYKSVMPDGRIVYSEKPTPGAKSVDTVDAPASSGVSVVTPQEKQRADQSKRDATQQARSNANAVEDARKQLKQAEAAREAAKESREGERLGTAKGGSRLTEEYFARQKQADEAVDTARKRLQELEGRR